jgi:hypothetical protein
MAHSRLSTHLSDLHVGRVPSHRAILLPVASITHQLAVPDPEVSAALAALGEHCDGGADVGRRAGQSPSFTPPGVS